ncbi:MAG: hypothetical protein NC820_05045 [Candidatus Omnitrophica bacterium]|nr:hypothetical protein [Candidatus Omnitrophota bacterium]
MIRKPKFKPQVLRVKLNPEQAVLDCNCYDVETKAGTGLWGVAKGETPIITICSGRLHTTMEICFHDVLPIEDFDHTAQRSASFSFAS